MEKSYNTNKNQIMNITNKLREYALGWDERNLVRRDLLAIADYIDMKYQKMLDEYNNERFNALMDARDDGVNAVLKEPKGFGLIALPKDADDVRWNVGDRDEYGNEVIELVLNSDGWYLINGTKCKANSIRHYHAPTVEDVLREFICDHEEGIRDEVDLIAEYAAKLQLKED